ncbi:hypothetical protein LXL04_011829 [Taraxacum kok-saghyz]
MPKAKMEIEECKQKSKTAGIEKGPFLHTGETPYTSAVRFEDLNLSPELLKGLYVEMKFERPSKIQSISLPMILTPPYKNLIAQAHNGSGKTNCFVLGMLSRVDPKLGVPQALCICPTRELAIQSWPLPGQRAVERSKEAKTRRSPALKIQRPTTPRSPGAVFHAVSCVAGLPPRRLPRRLMPVPTSLISWARVKGRPPGGTEQ